METVFQELSSHVTVRWESIDRLCHSESSLGLRCSREADVGQITWRKCECSCACQVERLPRSVVHFTGLGFLDGILKEDRFELEVREVLW